MPELIPPFAHFAGPSEEAVHRPFGTMVGPFVEEHGIDLPRRLIHEARLMQHGQHPLLLGRREGPGPGRAWAPRPGGPALPIVAGPRHVERRTQRAHPQGRAPLGDDLHHRGSLGPSGAPSKAATFFWTSTIASARSARRTAAA